MKPIDNDLRALLDAEAKAPPPADLAQIQARVFEGVQAQIGGGGPGGGAPSGGGTWTSAAVTKITGLGVAVGLAVGGVTGWSLRGETPPEVVTVHVRDEVAPTPTPPPEPPAAPEATTQPEPAPPVAPVAEAVEHEEPVVEEGDSERALIDQARVALRRGRAHDALIALMRHQRLHVDGALTEERERLIIEALAAEGRLDEASERAAAFRQRWPTSIYLPTLEEF